jgi:hypothetical protein
VLCDLLTDQMLAQLPLTGVSFDRRISRTGSLQGTLTASTKQLVAYAKIAHAYAGRSALWVYRDRELWWGGIPWTVQAKQGPKDAVVASITAATFDSYAHHRELYDSDANGAPLLGTNSALVYASGILGMPGIDQGIIIPDLWRRIQSHENGDIGVVAEDQPTGILRERTYQISELAKVGKLIEDLGDVIDGPEHTIDTYLDDAGNRIKRLRVANQLGTSEPRIVFQRAVRGGGRIVEWEHIADAVDGGTSFRTRGQPETGNVGEDNPPQLSTTVVRQDLLDAGWPLLDVSEDHDTTTSSETLNGHAEALAAQFGGSMPTSGYSVQVGNTGWSPNRLGDRVRLKLTDAWHDSADLTVRPVGCKVTPAEKGTPEQVTLLLGDED